MSIYTHGKDRVLSIEQLDKLRLIDHEIIQQHLERLYNIVNADQNFSPGNKEIIKSNEVYGELYYYSMLKLLKHLNISNNDHFLDLGSGFGKIVFQVFLITQAASVTGIEINYHRFMVAHEVKKLLEKELPNLLQQKNKAITISKAIKLIHGDFLEQNIAAFNQITIIYLCCTVFSMDLLDKIQDKIINMPNVQKIITFKHLPKLINFNLKRKFFLHGDWDYTTCYLYTKKIHKQHKFDND